MRNSHQGGNIPNLHQARGAPDCVYNMLQIDLYINLFWIQYAAK